MHENYKIPFYVPKSSLAITCLVIATAIIHPTVLGYDSMMMGSILNLELYTDYFDLTTVTIGLNTAGSWMGQILSCITVSSYLGDWVGRRFAIHLGLTLNFIGVILQSSSQNIAMFVIARMILGAGTSIAHVSAASLITELVRPKVRGFVMGICFACFGLGSIFASVVTFGTRNLQGNWSWRVPSIIQGVFALIALISLQFTPESPHYLLSKGNRYAAVEVIIRSQNVDFEEACKLADLYSVQFVETQKFFLYPWLEYLKGSGNRRRLFIFLSQAFITELGGSSVGSYFFSILLALAGVTGTTEKLQVTIVMGVWTLLVSCLGAYFFDRIGRRTQALISMIGMSATFFVLGGLIKKFGSGYSKSGLYGAVAVMFIFTGFYSFTFTPLTMAYPGEISRPESRCSGVSLFTFMNSSFGLVSSFILPIAMSNIGWKFYMVNAGYNIIFIPIIYFVWVETKKLSLIEIEAIFDGVRDLPESTDDLSEVEEIIGTVEQKNID